MARLRRSRAAAAAALLVASACTGAPPAETSPDGSSSVPDRPTPSASVHTQPVHAPDGEFVLGYVLPTTGFLSFLGPIQARGIELAVHRANQAGGVLGQPVRLLGEEETDRADQAAAAAGRLLSEGVDAIVGAASSAMSLAFVHDLAAAGVAQCSASNTSPIFTDLDDDGWYFRTAPTDALQGPALAQVLVEDGRRNVVLLARADEYGQGLAEATERALRDEGAEATRILYDGEATDFTDEVGRVVALAPDAVVVIAFSEASLVLRDLVEAGWGPTRRAVYGADGLRTSTLWQEVDPQDPSVLAGLQGTAPDPGATDDFLEALAGFAPELTDTIFASHAYDCANLFLLAAVAAGTDAGGDFRQAVLDVSRDGTPCLDFASCAALLAQGEDIDYQGASGPVDLTDAGEPTTGVYEHWKVGQDGAVMSVRNLDVGPR